MTPITDLTIGDIMQLNPDPAITRNPMFCACLFVVSEPKQFGAQGYVQGLGENDQSAGQAYYRANWSEMEPTGGVAEWIAGGWRGGETAPRTATFDEFVLVEQDELRRLQAQIESNTALIKGTKP